MTPEGICVSPTVQRRVLAEYPCLSWVGSVGVGCARTLACSEFECGFGCQSPWPFTNRPGGHMRTHAPMWPPGQFVKRHGDWHTRTHTNSLHARVLAHSTPTGPTQQRQRYSASSVFMQAVFAYTYKLICHCSYFALRSDACAIHKNRR